MSKTAASNSKTARPEGYSGTPLYQKLGIRAGQRVWLISGPGNYLQWLPGLPDGVEIRNRRSSQTGLVHLFATRQPVLQKKLQQLRHCLEPQVPVWVSWPKKASGVPSDITEDTVRQAALPLGYVDIKVCAVNEVWSGLKLVVRKELR